MTRFSKMELPAVYDAKTSFSTSFQMEGSTFGILTIPTRQLDWIQLDLTSIRPDMNEAWATLSAPLSPETEMLLERGLADAAAGRVTLVPPELYQDTSIE